MLSADEIQERRAALADSPDLQGLFATIARRAAPLAVRLPEVPARKALLSADGGVCPDHGTPLGFEPWSPRAHRCAGCGPAHPGHAGERHDLAWAKFQHLWLAERAADLAVVAAFARDEAEADRAAERAGELLRAYGERYFACPNVDNVLGPTRLFFSTYLESIWITGILTAAHLLRETGRLDDATAEAVSRIADEAAALIGEFDEGFSNRQTWHAAALTAIAVWFEDADLAARGIESETGLLAHLVRGFGRDGMWYEGENYHLFALRGLLTGLRWARQAGIDAVEDPRLAARLRAALRAPALSALPDATFPARKDSRFGVSLAQPMYLELWETGRAALADHGEDDGGIADWLAALYGAEAPPVTLFESWLHDPAGALPEGGAGAHRSRRDLSWWAFLAMPPALEGEAEAWRPESTLLESQGLAVLRAAPPGGLRYAALECGAYGGGHGHPDRLNLTAHDGRTHWLPDFGTGSYVARDLFWYRSTLAHNAPGLDGRSQPPGDAACEAFDARDGWSWARGTYGPARRTLVSGPDGLLDVLEVADEFPRLVDLPWHFPPETRLATAGRWEEAALGDVDPVAAEFLREARRFVPETPGELRFEAPGLAVLVAAPPAAELWRAVAPGAPGEAEPRPFWFLRHRDRMTRVVTALVAGELASSARALAVEGETAVLDLGGRRVRHRATSDGWVVETPDGAVHLAGLRPPAREAAPLFTVDRALRSEGEALPLDDAPALDGTLRGFDLSAPLALDHEDQYRRSETPYEGPEAFAATAWVNWSEEALHLAVEVVKPELVLRPAGAPPLRLDNEPDAIHGDGLQVYLRRPGDDAVAAVLLAPDPAGSGLLVRPVAGTLGHEVAVRGAWRPTAGGYAVTATLALPGWPLEPEAELGFDLIVNEMRSGRQRRAGQLVWSGGGGWVWLRGDRQDPARFGVLRLEGAR